MNSFQPTRKGVKESIKSHEGLMSDHAMRKAMTINQGKHIEKPQAKSHKNQTRQAHRKATSQITQESNTQK
jgi:hypothetical protein